jgi:hypothetical protein
MKFLSAFFILVLISSVPNKEIRLEKTQKVLSTFSGNINENSSFHLILTKNLKANKHNILAYIFEEEGISEMPVIEFDNKFDFMSFHTNGDVITLITKTKIGKQTSIDVIDIDISNGKVTRSDQIFNTEDLKTVVRAENKNVLLYANEFEMSTVTIHSANDFKESFVIKNKDNKDFITRLAEKTIDAIKTTEYTNDGSVNEFKAYLTDDELLVTQDDQFSGQINILKMPTTVDGQQFINLQTFTQDSDKRYRKNSSYINDNKLFQLRVGKTNVDLNIFDLENSAVKTIDLTTSQVQEFSSDKEATLNYQKEALKRRNQPTITVNTAANSSYSLKFNFENKDAYRYYDNWWLHHDWMWNQHLMHDQMIQQQQRQMMNNLPKFGPNSNEPEYLLYTNTESKKKNSSFEIGVNSNADILPASELQTVFKEIDKKSYIEKLEEDTYLRHTSSTFTDSTCIYITYNRKTKTFIIKSELLDEL